MPLSGKLVAEARTEILGSFDLESLRKEVSDRLGRKLANITTASGFEAQVDELLEASSQEGWDEGLLNALIEARPGKPAFQARMQAILAASLASDAEPESQSGDMQKAKTVGKLRGFVSAYTRQLILGFVGAVGVAVLAWLMGAPGVVVRFFKGDDCVSTLQQLSTYSRDFDADTKNIDSLSRYIDEANMTLEANNSCMDSAEGKALITLISKSVAIAQSWLDARNLEFDARQFVEEFVVDKFDKYDDSNLNQAQLRGKQLLEQLSNARREIEVLWVLKVQSVVELLTVEIKSRHPANTKPKDPAGILGLAEIRQKYKQIEFAPKQSIPIIFHLLYNTSENEISDDQVMSQVNSLNRDFGAANGDLRLVPDEFKSAAGNAKIEFVLASRDPKGNPSNGIVRKKTEVASFDSDNAMKFVARGGDDAWDSSRYLNVWVAPLSGGMLSYAQFPGGDAATDGVVVAPTAFGTSGTARAPFNGGRNLAHEIGHYLGLHHIWGDSGSSDCSDDDGIADTPVQAGPSFGMPTFPQISCNNGPNGDMFMNFMDYVDDQSSLMFTEGQVVRMHEILEGPRKRLVEQQTN